jgi:glycosyltransferase involved in cell wall biosynthesis
MNAAYWAVKGVSVSLLVAFLGITLLNALYAPRLHRAVAGSRRPRVSVLVPARDEADTLSRTLPLLAAQDYPALEVLVLDDESTDETAAVVARTALDFPRVRLLRGSAVPPGWTGKCWACHQLAGSATGEVMVFCDADVEAQPGAVRQTVDLLEHSRAHALTALPRSRTGSPAESAIVPLVTQVSVLAMLPLPLVPRRNATSISMGNGQWLAFTRTGYRAAGGHAAVAGDVLEDVALARRVKAAGGRLIVALAPRSLAVRMYRGAREVRHGFRKNLYTLVGGSPGRLLVALVVFWLTAVQPWAAMAAGSALTWAAAGLLLTIRVVSAVTLGHGWLSVALHPAASLALPLLAVDAAVASWRGTATWRGRRLAPAVSTTSTEGDST